MIDVSSPPKPPSPLATYRDKRDPARTNEPFSPEPLASGSTWLGRFVVHEHDATNRHYDLRLEMSGTLKSFAVPRGPSLDPEDKRLAIQTEDHPIIYADFEGVIPEKNYGAGAMIAWDVGRVRYLENDAETGVRNGKIDFELYGYKLRGRFALVLTSGRKGQKTKQPQWLLLKKRDGFERPGSVIIDEQPESVLSGLKVSELEHAKERVAAVVARAQQLGAKPGELDARGLVPMVCSTGGGKLEGENLLYELKLDGVRIVAEKRGDEVALYYRKGRSGTASYPDVARAIRALPYERVVLDGEIVAFDGAGKPDFQRLAQRFAVSKAREVQQAMLEVPVTYVAFDVLALESCDLTRLPLLARKEILRDVVPARGTVRALDHLVRDGRPLYAFCLAQKLEGVIVKRADGPYRVGPRPSADWCKIKCEREDDFVVFGYTRGEGKRASLGALELGSYEGDELVARGRVGSGFDGATIDLLLRELDALRVDKVAFRGELETAPHGETFVRPELVVNVRYLGFTNDAHLRQPVFQGLRADVAPRDCTARPHVEAQELFEQVDAEVALPEPPVLGKPAARTVKLTNSKKVFWPADGLTKGDLCAYYEAIAPTLLPYLRERPVILVRYPDGIEGKSFYQWNVPRGTPSWVRTVKVRWEDRDNKEADLFLLDDVNTLLYVANLGCIPLHILAARIGTLANADFLTIDFDLNGQPLSHGITLARTLRELLDQLGLQGFPKTSGQTGLHVLVPLGPNVNFTTAKVLAELLGGLVVRRHPDISTMERVRDRRGPRVYVDTGQTGTIRAIVSPYSVRAYPGGRVSTPLVWDEVGFALDPGRFTITTVPERARTVGDPMAGMFEVRPDIAAAVSVLEALLKK
jgi:bifunctional non-homologous end joining protein LigD